MIERYRFFHLQILYLLKNRGKMEERRLFIVFFCGKDVFSLVLERI